MAENRNMYGGHDVSGYVPPTSNALPSENPDQAPDLNMEYLEKVSSINTDDMLKDISELKKQGVGLSASAMEILQDAGGSIKKEMEEYLERDFVGQVDAHMDGLKNKVETIEATHRQALDKLKHEYEESINTLESKQGKLLAQAIEEKNLIILPFESFWAILCILGVVILCGFMCWIKFWRTAGNDETMTYMTVACILEVIYYGMMAWNHFTANEKQNNEKSKVFSVSLSEAIYIILIAFASIVYIVWSQLIVIGSTKMLIYLLPMVFASNFIWLLLQALAYGVFQEDWQTTYPRRKTRRGHHLAL